MAMASLTVAVVPISVVKSQKDRYFFKSSSVVSFPLKTTHKAGHRGLVQFQPRATGPTTPPDLSAKVSESIGKAQEACAEDPQSGECVAAWDEVEELSAAASHARARLQPSDPLEDYCQDNPETDECRMYED